jgi:hypothetical protein
MAWATCLATSAGAVAALAAGVDAGRLAAGEAPVEAYDAAWHRAIAALPEPALPDLRRLTADPDVLPGLALGAAVAVAAAGAARAGHRDHLRRHPHGGNGR